MPKTYIMLPVNYISIKLGAENLSINLGNSNSRNIFKVKYYYLLSLFPQRQSLLTFSCDAFSKKEHIRVGLQFVCDRSRVT